MWRHNSYRLRVTARVVEIKNNSLCSTIISSTPIIRHVKVKGTASPDDPSLRDYWHKRSHKTGKHKWAKGSKYEQVAKMQEHKCPVCGDSLYNEEEIEAHHIVPVSATRLRWWLR